MKNKTVSLIGLMIAFIFTSCATKQVIRYSGVYPVTGVNATIDLASDNVEIIGRATGVSKVQIDRAKKIKYLRGDEGKYAVLAIDIAKENSSGIIKTGVVNPKIYDIAVANASYDLVKQADEKGADFIVFPHITADIDHEGDILEVQVSALLCRMKRAELVEENSKEENDVL